MVFWKSKSKEKISSTKDKIEPESILKPPALLQKKIPNTKKMVKKVQKKHKIRNQNQTGINIEACRPSPKHQVVLQGSVPLSKGIPEQAQHYHIQVFTPQKYFKGVPRYYTKIFLNKHNIFISRCSLHSKGIHDICHFLIPAPFPAKKNDTINA